VELPAGTIEPGQTKIVDLPLAARGAGKYSVRATVTADGNVAAAGDPIAIEVRRAELTTTVAGPKLTYINQDFAWAIAVGNNGDGPISNVQVRATLPAEVRVKDAAGGKPGAGSVEWKIDSLKAGEQRTLKLAVDAVKLNDRATISILTTADAAGMSGGPVGDPVQVRAESTVAIIGTPALSLTVASPAGPIDLGKRATFQIRVTNKGTVLARNVDVAAFAPAELKPARGYGKSEGKIDMAGTVAFPTIEELRPGETAAFMIEVEAGQAGDARFRVEVKAADLTTPLKDEQALRVIGK
jgi:hypothetical protein